ncbi:hypothetical protein [Paenibacillus sacheonensis]|uniref:PepSY domain-containing protein n=1 Tax=Paenibacillus sacheonensis TaxID=742054 RepID=A0A7X4YUD1_9BACL|nr:hypothetical protein [Paenibacillus sacheonensis]MBM7569111.1 hypothetical protein [Paenibacillus sacheonensis]NBC72715.1 hypothetical protein [Paenibacillus sacheonensis]
MNRFALILASAALLLITSGCSSFFEAVPKNVVMVKKYSGVDESSQPLKAGEILSLQTTKSLGLNAVKKYFDKQISEDDVQFELTTVELNALRVLVEHDIRPDVKQDAEAKLKEVPEGLFYLTITFPDNERYELVLNARTGDVLKISNQSQIGDVSAGNSKEMTSHSDSENVNKFLQEKEGLNPKDIKETAVFAEGKASYYLINIENDSLKYVIEFDTQMNKVMGFSKGIMALLTWGSKVTTKVPTMQE